MASHQPEILAPAGNRDAFLAALAAGADAVYCGLKAHSARMAAKNFSIEELCKLTRLAHENQTRVYVTVNTLIKTGETPELAALLQDLHQRVRPDGLIIQDLAILELVHHMGSDVEIHLSTLANVSFPAALQWVRAGLNISRVVVPRELSIDEIKFMASQCPGDLALEVFIHGALCYAVSGRCYWSSLLGGRSGLRGRCVQPCRRRYVQQGQTRRMFSCQDLSLDVLVKTLRPIPQIRAWKIEGRKKGAHYVYYTVTAYRMLRDLDPEAADKSEVKKAAMTLLGQALGRTGTHYHFLPQRPQNPVHAGGHSGSGMLIGTIKGSVQQRFFSPRIPLMRDDVLRIGYEDDRWHQRLPIRKSVPARGRFQLKSAPGKIPPSGTPVFLIDRSERQVREQIAGYAARLKSMDCPAAFRPAAGDISRVRRKPRLTVIEMPVYRSAPRRRNSAQFGLWLPDHADRLPRATARRHPWWWLSPALWPDAEARLLPLIDTAIERGAAGFVVNAPWQAALFTRKQVPIWAGPFCNIANELAIAALARLGYAGVIVSPELGQQEVLDLPAISPIPLGIVISGHWPFCIVRRTAQEVKLQTPFTSPRGETAWMVQYGDNYWMFPNWLLDLKAQHKRLQQAGYHWLIHLHEPLPAGIDLKKRPGLWNWDVGLT